MKCVSRSVWTFSTVRAVQADGVCCGSVDANRCSTYLPAGRWADGEKLCTGKKTVMPTRLKSQSRHCSSHHGRMQWGHERKTNWTVALGWGFPSGQPPTHTHTVPPNPAASLRVSLSLSLSLSLSWAPQAVFERFGWVLKECRERSKLTVTSPYRPSFSWNTKS